MSKYVQEHAVDIRKICLRNYKSRQFRTIASLLIFAVGGLGAASAAPPPVARAVQTVSPSVKRNQAENVSRSAVTTEAFVPKPLTTQVSGPGVTFTCDATIAQLGPAGLCASLGAVLGPIYKNTFTNANASIYIEFNSAAGLADSTPGFYNLVPYTTYQAALQANSTDPAKGFVPAAEPGIFGTLPINLPSALAQALGITAAANAPGGTLGPIAGLTAAGDFCTTPGTGGCYNGLIRVNTPANLKSQIEQGYTYRSLGGSTTGTTDNYDFYSVVEHETDEILGSASCISYNGDGTVTNPGSCASAVDMFRYTSTGTRTFNTLPSIAYFSPDGGLTDTQGNTYNTTSPGGDWADFSQSCVFVQDAGACPSSINANNSLDITTEGPGRTAGPEVAILNAVGYNLVPVVAGGTPSVVSVTPSSGTGSSQTFAMTYSDSAGVSDLTLIKSIINTSASGANACYVIYYPSSNRMFLYNDAGNSPLTPGITPGDANTVSNSQCTLSGSGSSASPAGNTLTLSAALSFTSKFAGQKGVYLYAQGSNGNTGFVGKGTWNPGTGFLSPSSLNFGTQTDGVASAAQTVTLTNSGSSALSISGIAFSGANATDFSQTNTCGSSVGVGGTCTISVVFNPTAVGSRNATLTVTDSSGSQTAALAGTGTTANVPTVVSVSPNAGTGSTQTFVMAFSDPMGTSDLTFIKSIVNTSASGANACYVIYYPSTNRMFLYNDAGSAALSPGITPGIAGTVSNSQCTLSGVGSSVNTSGNNLTLSTALTFASGFTGQKSIYLYAAGSNGNSGFVGKGTWTP
jgi:hypothetical protein